MGSTERTFVIILAAGQSKRMQQSKIVLPWGKTTIITHIISEFKKAGIGKIVVVTGGYRDLVETEVIKSGAEVAFNSDFENDEMSISLNVGLSAIEIDNYSAGFIALGDQPNVYSDDIAKMGKKHQIYPEKIIIPSYSMRRGHPWLIPNKYFNELLKLSPPDTLRTFLNDHLPDIEYVVVDHPEVLQDLDTPQEYQQAKPK
jgi:molybdenum cofactor cytidylyltransferase